MVPSAVSFANSKSKSILVKLVCQTKTGFSFIHKRSQLHPTKVRRTWASSKGTENLPDQGHKYLPVGTSSGSPLAQISRYPQGPQRTLHVILGSLVSGTQHQFQFNFDGPMTAGTRTPEPFLTRGLGSFWSVLVYLGFEQTRQLHSPQRKHHFQAL